MSFFWEVGDLQSVKTNIRTFKSGEWNELLSYCQRKRNRFIVQAVQTMDVTEEVLTQLENRKKARES